MLTLGTILAWSVAAALLVPLAMLSLELLAAQFPARSQSITRHRPRAAVVIPAHDEQDGIAATIAGVQPQLAAGDRILVVADNCTDATAQKARDAGAAVVERHDDRRRGKGFALAFGIHALADDAPDVVIVIDADTTVLPGAIDALAIAAAERPAQAVNLLEAPSGSGPGARLSAFAFLLRNYVRPRGLDRLGLPCLLYGTGMAIPYTALTRVDLYHGDITEDIRLGVELTLAGHPPALCPTAHVRGELPRHRAAIAGQRRRWEHGHLNTLLRHVPKLIREGVRQRRHALIGMGLHLGVPPLSLLFLAVVGAAAILAICGNSAPSATLCIAALTTAILIALAWLRFARDRLPARDLLLLPVYAAVKLPLYLSFWRRPQHEWVRTPRG
jgi:cellulose synthase/poly-beta-1,6-N-acetylglucosamine synthase-like glycosyltransferase